MVKLYAHSLMFSHDELDTINTLLIHQMRLCIKLKHLRLMHFFINRGILLKTELKTVNYLKQ